MGNKEMVVRFWGVRGSVPSPLTGSQVTEKINDVLRSFAANGIDLRGMDEAKIAAEVAKLPFAMRSTYGGNTTCVEIRCGDDLIICDMGTGIRELGKALIPEMKANKGLRGTILQSHVHWDHIQGLPFFAPLYTPREFVANDFDFFGGKAWDADIETVLRGQMQAPVFPVDLELIKSNAMRMDFKTIYDRWTLKNAGASGFNVRARVLNHPQETFGYRIMRGGKIIAFTTDHEPYATPDAKLIELVQDADIWITDCQYSYDIFTGKIGGVPRHGWGHSFPEAIAEAAKIARPKLIVLTHFDPDATDQHIISLSDRVQQVSGIPTIPAYEGLQLAA